MTLLKMSRAYWETAVQYKGADKCILKHYDILKYMGEGHSRAQASIKFGFSVRQINRIQKMYK